MRALTPRLRRSLAVAVSALVAIGMTVTTAPVRATADFDFDRIFGGTRYDTAAEIALEAFPDGATGAVIATGEDYPDALAGAFLAGWTDVPVLLVRSDEVPAATSDALRQLGVETVVLLGGTVAISAEVAATLDADYDVVRLFGENRFETAREIAETANPTQIGEVDGKSTAIVASGFGFADALAAGPLSFSEQFPILLTGPAGLAAPARDALEDLSIEHVLIVGGTAVVSDTVKQEIEALGITTERLAGADRFETATEIADFAVAELGFTDAHLNLAKGIHPGNADEGFADALAGAPHAGGEQSVILLTDPEQLSAPTQTWIERNNATLDSGHIFGGPSAVSAAVEAAAVQAARNVAGEVVRTEQQGMPSNTYLYVPEGASAAVTVGYSEEDEFVVNGTEATFGLFEQVLTPGDRIQYISGSPNVHRLTNIAPEEINSRTVGNIDLADNNFDYINDVTGDWIVRNASWKDTDTFFVDGDPATAAEFEADLNEGDVITLNRSTSPLTYALTNKVTTGVAVAIENSSPSNQQSIKLRISVYGDIPETSSDSSQDSAGQGNDDKYRADNPAFNDPRLSGRQNDVFGGEATTYDEFKAELTEGDIVTYTRVGGVETYTLNNRPKPTITGTAVSLDKEGDGNPLTGDRTDGGEMTLALPDGSEQTYAYIHNGEFVICDAECKLATEAEFEAQFSEGDKVVYRPADPAANQTQRIELTNVAPAS